MEHYKRTIKDICETEGNQERKQKLRELIQTLLLTRAHRDYNNAMSRFWNLCVKDIIHCKPFTIHSADNLDVMFSMIAIEMNVAFAISMSL